MAYYRYSGTNYYRPSLFGGFRFFPPVIKWLLISNTAVFLLMMLLGVFRAQAFPLAAVIGEYFPLYPLGHGFYIWQLITYLFMHGGFLHLLFNMFALWMFGMELENTWGSKKFLVYYLLCGIGAGISNLLIGPLVGQAGPTIGASGAIYGVLIAFGMMFPDRPIFVYFLLPIRAKYFVLFYILLELYAGVTGTPDGIAHFAHLGGAAIGFVYILIDQDRIPLKRHFLMLKRHVSTPDLTNVYSSQYRRESISDAKYYDLHDEDHVDQQQIDEILDKISQHGYQSLTEKEKKLLFEASKKMN
jgi:membrane associated rhomboid family serine protease